MIPTTEKDALESQVTDFDAKEVEMNQLREAAKEY